MKITGNKNWPYRAVINAAGVKQMYTMPTEEKFQSFLSTTKIIFPFVKIEIIQFGPAKQKA